MDTERQAVGIELSESININIFNAILERVYLAVIRTQIIIDAVSSRKITFSIDHGDSQWPRVDTLGERYSLRKISEMLNGVNGTPKTCFNYIKELYTNILNANADNVICYDKRRNRLFDFRENKNLKDAVIAVIPDGHDVFRYHPSITISPETYTLSYLYRRAELY